MRRFCELAARRFYGGDAMDSEAGLDSKSTVQLLFLCAEAAGGVGHLDDQRLVDLDMPDR